MAKVINRLAYSGGVEWWNPATGERLDKAPTVRFRVRPADVLTGDEGVQLLAVPARGR